MPIELTNNLLRDYILRKLGSPRPQDGKLHLIGLRSARKVSDTAITRIHPLPDHYDDVLVCFGTVLRVFPCTVDPGVRYNLRPINPRGTAHLCNGGPYRYFVGKHRGKPGLVQGGPFKIWRDQNRNGVQDTDETPRWEEGIGINLHRGGTSANVGPWSAGCQVLPLAEWPAFWQVIEQSGQKQFNYYLGDAAGLL